MGWLIVLLQRSLPLVLGLLLALSPLAATQLGLNPSSESDNDRIEPEDSASRVAMDACIEKFYEAESHYGQHVVDRDTDTECIVKRTYLLCIKAIPMANSPAGTTLNIEGTRSVLQKRMREIDCPEEGPVYVEGPTKAEPCTYLGTSDQVTCAVWGDPHLYRLNGQLETCVARGTWALIDNTHFTVMITNAGLSGTMNATYVEKVTVLVKANDICAGRRYALYQASAQQPLPDTFRHGSTALEPLNKVSVALSPVGDRAWVRIPHVATTIEIQQLAGWLSVIVRLPVAESERDKRGADFAPVQLCHDGCPSSQLIDRRLYLAQRAARWQPQGLARQRSVAVRLCRDAELTGQFFDTCVFDLITSRQVNLTLHTVAATRSLPPPRPSNRDTRSEWADLQSYDEWYETSVPRYQTSGYCSLALSTLLLWLTVLHILATFLQTATPTQLLVR